MLLAGVLLVAANLRAVLTSVGPVLPLMAEDGLSPSLLGVLVAIPVATFAVVSPFVHPLAVRWGVDRTVLAALVVLALGSAIRSVGGDGAGLWIGTVLLGAAIAVGNVLLPVATKTDFPERLPAVTGQYMAVQSVVAGIAAGLAVPVAHMWDSWELAIGIWAVLVVVALVAWAPRLSRRNASGGVVEPPGQAAPTVRVWRSAAAWQVAVYFMLQSAAFYTLINWLPTVEQDLGISSAAAGWHLSLFMVVGILANLGTPLLFGIGGDQRFAAVVMPVGMIVAFLGMLLLPAAQALWAALAGFALGGAMVTSLSLIGLRSGDPRTASRLSAMVQTVAYGGVSVALVLAGVIRDVAGPGPHLLFYVLAFSVALIVAGLFAGRRSLVR